MVAKAMVAGIMAAAERCRWSLRIGGGWMKRLAFLMAMTAVLPGLANSSRAQAETPTASAHGSAPLFSRPDLDHRQVSLAAYRGKVVVLNFWATWCAPCLMEMPRFVEWQQQYGGRGLQVIGVSMDDEATPVRAAYKKLGLNYPVLMGDEKLGQMYGGVLGLPVTFLIDAQGKIRFKHEGAVDLSAMEREIQSLLPGPGSFQHP